MKKITISISEELNTVLSTLAKIGSISKSRLIENYLRANPWVQIKLDELKRNETVQCGICRITLGLDHVQIRTPTHGIICDQCWAHNMGEITESLRSQGEKRKKDLKESPILAQIPPQ